MSSMATELVILESQSETANNSALVVLLHLVQFLHFGVTG